MLKKFSSYTAILVSTVLLFCVDNIVADPSNQKKASAREIGGQEREHTVTRVLDGDTFVLSDNSRVRLIGVDTPEKGEPFGDMARNFADSILTGKTITIEYDKMRHDRYDRILGYVFLDTIFFNELIIRRGLAHVYLFKENKRYSKRLMAAQNEARRHNLGIWSTPQLSDEPYYVSAGGSYRFHRPLCPLVKRINPNKAKKYVSRDSALDEGLSPCRECRP